MTAKFAAASSAALIAVLLAVPASAQDATAPASGEERILLAQARAQAADERARAVIEAARALERERAEAAADAIRASVFSPEFIILNGEAASLGDGQRQQIIARVEALRAEVEAMHVDMERARAELAAAMRARTLDEARVMSELDEVLEVERAFKRAHLLALLRIRDVLTDAQRARLEALRAARE